MARLLADEQFPMPIVHALRLLGHDVVTVREAGEAKQGEGWPDDYVLAYATERHRAVLTQNVSDFRVLHSAMPGHRGIILCPHMPKSPAKQQARAIDGRIKQALRAGGTLHGQLIVLRRGS